MKFENLVEYSTMAQFDKANSLEAIAKHGHPCILSPTNTILYYQGNIYGDLESIRAVNRLWGIKQLGLANTCGYSACSSGDRLAHSQICATEIDKIAQRNKLNERNLGIIAGMTHDIATTPLSDSTSLGLGLNDEEQFEHVLNSYPQFDKLLYKYSVSKKDLVDAVTGKGNNIISRLINSKNSLDVDRWSYTIHDSWNLDLLPKTKKKVTKRFPQGNFRLEVRNPYVPKPFNDITIENKEVIFNDIKSLSDTLEARTRMTTDIYNNPELLAKEAFLEDISKSLLEKGIITKESLFKMGDDDFIDIVERHGGKIGSDLFRFFKFDSYGTVNADEDALREFLSSRVKTPFAVKKQRRFNTAADSLVMVEDNVDKYRNWEPAHALSMEERMASLSKTFVYGLEDDQKLLEEVKRAQRKFGAI